MTAKPAYLTRIGTGPLHMVLLTPYLFPAALYESLTRPWQASHTFWVPDYPGYGLAKDVEGPYNPERYATWVAEVLTELPPMPVMGYSMGGLVAQHYAATHPQRVTRLILACTYAHKPQTLLERSQRTLFVPLVKRLGPAGLARVMYGELRHLTGTRPRGLVALKELVLQNRPDVIAENARALFQTDTRPLLPHIAHPTLVVAGEKDWIVPAHHALQLAETLPQAQLQTLPGAGHFAVFSHSGQFWPLVLRFAFAAAP